jgi:hypothetical protein
LKVPSVDSAVFGFQKLFFPRVSLDWCGRMDT